jgi:hypothetical protein
MGQITDSKKRFFKTRQFFILCCAIAFVAGGLVVSIFWHYHTNALIKSIADQVNPSRQNNNQYTYINPLLGYNVPGNVKEFDEYNTLINKVDDVIAQNKNSNVDGFSFYFRDLTLGRWAGENENISYSPGSMMKVAIMVTYFKDAESDPSVLEKTLVYSSRRSFFLGFKFTGR